MSGYVNCACRDCFEIAIASEGEKDALCHECEEAGCCPHVAACEVEWCEDDQDPDLHPEAHDFEGSDEDF